MVILDKENTVRLLVQFDQAEYERLRDINMAPPDARMPYQLWLTPQELLDTIEMTAGKAAADDFRRMIEGLKVPS